MCVGGDFGTFNVHIENDDVNDVVYEFIVTHNY